MISKVTVILSVSLGFVNWLFWTLAIMLHLRLTAKKKWHKNEKKYPYFHYPFYKKLFLLGLKGALSVINVVATFIFNITVIILIILSVWYVISPGIILSYIIRVLCGIYAVAFLLKIGAYVGFPPNL